MEGLLSTGPTPSSFLMILHFLKSSCNQCRGMGTQLIGYCQKGLFWRDSRGFQEVHGGGGPGRFLLFYSNMSQVCGFTDKAVPTMQGGRHWVL